MSALKRDLLLRRLCHEVALDPLTEAQVVEYLCAESAEGSSPKGLAELVSRHSEGNPLFMVAALDHLVQRGLISREDGSWHVRVPLEEIDPGVPETLRQMIEAQIGRLSMEEQRALEVGSVQGAIFSTTICAAVANGDAEAYENLYDSMAQRRRIVRAAGCQRLPDGSISSRYEFSHALYREVLYRRQAPLRRAKLHRRIGERLEAVYSQQLSDVGSELAHHFEEGADWPRTVKYLRLAADAAQRRYGHQEAMALLEHALDLVGRLLESERAAAEMEVLQQLAVLYVARYESAPALRTYERLLALATKQGLLDIEITALIDMVLPAVWTSAQLYRDTIEKALHLNVRQEDPLARARARAKCLSYRVVADHWRPEDAASFREALEEIERLGDSLTIATHRLEFTIVQWLSSKYEEAHRSTVANLSILLQQSGLNSYLESVCLRARYNDRKTLLFWGKWGQALQEVESETALCEANGDHARAQEVRLQEAWVCLYARDFDRVIECCESIEASVTLPAPNRAWHILMGSALVEKGKQEGAQKHLTKVSREMQRSPLMDDWYQAMALHAALVDLGLAKDDYTEARGASERFLESALATDEHTFQGLAWEAAARVAIAQRDWQRAENNIRQGIACLDGYEVPLAAWRLHGTAATISRHAGDRAASARNVDLSGAVIMQLANSLDPEHPVRSQFLASGSVRTILNHRTAPLLSA